VTEIVAGGVRERYEDASPASRALWDRALLSLPAGNTRTTIFHDPYPVYVATGDGCRVTDVDGVERIDFISNYTSLILGHCHPHVVEAVQRQASRLMSVAAPTELEVELAELIRGRLPSVERLRFANSGTEATMHAIRAARAFTGRTTIATFAGGYHGSHDYAASIPADPGLPSGGPGIPSAAADTIVVAPFDDVEGTRAVLEPHLDDLAGVIVEPVMGSGGVLPASAAFLTYLRELTRKADALLVFDEVISFRVGYNGAQGRLGVDPDLTTLGKIIGGGLPVGAFGGREDVMALFDPRADGTIPHGGTFNGNPLTMAAGIATLDEMTPERYAGLEGLAVELKDKLTEALGAYHPAASVTQAASLFNLHFDDPSTTRELHLALLNHGILLTARGMGCLSAPMTSCEIDALVDAVQIGLAQIDRGVS
jgi:glutamate-1-semialdehyde 2,1-aminomutase